MVEKLTDHPLNQYAAPAAVPGTPLFVGANGKLYRRRASADDLDALPVGNSTNPGLRSISERIISASLDPDSERRIDDILQRVRSGSGLYTAIHRMLTYFEEHPRGEYKVRHNTYPSGVTFIWDKIDAIFEDVIGLRWVRTSSGTLFPVETNSQRSNAFSAALREAFEIVLPRHTDRDHYVLTGCIGLATDRRGVVAWEPFINAFSDMSNVTEFAADRVMRLASRSTLARNMIPQQLLARDTAGLVNLAATDLIDLGRLNAAKYGYSSALALIDGITPVKDVLAAFTVGDILASVLTADYDAAQAMYELCRSRGLVASENDEPIGADGNGNADGDADGDADDDFDSVPLEYSRNRREETRRATQYSKEYEAIAEAITNGVMLAYSGLNWFATPPSEVITTNADLLGENLLDIVRRMPSDPMEVTSPSLRAKALLLATARVFGFKRIPAGWTKSNGKTTVTIFDNGEVNINGSFRCVVFERERNADVDAYSTMGLPYGDEIAARMWMFASNMRNSVYTIRYDIPELEVLFAERAIKNKSISQLAEEIYAKLQKQHLLRRV